jgi:hypothetical protein
MQSYQLLKEEALIFLSTEKEIISTQEANDVFTGCWHKRT